METNYKEIDMLKGLAISLVILGHAIIYYPLNLHEISWCSALFTWLSSVHMPLFFAVSGFCFRIGSEQRYGAFLWKKTRRLILPYIFFGLLDIFPRSLFPQLVNRSRGLGESIYKMVFFGGEYWFLYTLFIIMALFGLAAPVLNGKKGVQAGILAAALLLNLWSGAPELFCCNYICKYFLFFFLGYLCRQHIHAAEKWRKVLQSPPCIAVAFGAWLVLLWVQMNYAAPAVLVTAASVAGVSALVGFVCKTAHRSAAVPFCEFGKYSLQLYLLNGFMLVLSRTVICSLLNCTQAWLITLFNVLVDLPVSYAIIRYVLAKIPVVHTLCGL